MRSNISPKVTQLRTAGVKMYTDKLAIKSLCYATAVYVKSDTSIRGILRMGIWHSSEVATWDAPIPSRSARLESLLF